MRISRSQGGTGVKIVFMGTPEFAVPTLRRLVEEGLAPAAVYSQPTRRQGRGLRVVLPPVAKVAQELSLPLRQPEVLQSKKEMEFLRELAPDLIITAAYGKIFRRRLLGLPGKGCLNLHPSLLPKYRGVSPIQTAILRGDSHTGVSIYQMDERVDAGPILLQRDTLIAPDDTGGSLSGRLASLGAEMMCAAVRSLEAGRLNAMPQDEARASYAPRLARGDGCLDWRLPAGQINRTVRALFPWPGTFTYCRSTRVKILEVEVIDEADHGVPPGTILSAGGKHPPIIAALPGAVALRQVQPENCRAQDGTAFCCGQRVGPGVRLRGGPTEEPSEAEHA